MVTTSAVPSCYFRNSRKYIPTNIIICVPLYFHPVGKHHRRAPILSPEQSSICGCIVRPEVMLICQCYKARIVRPLHCRAIALDVARRQIERPAYGSDGRAVAQIVEDPYNGSISDQYPPFSVACSILSGSVAPVVPALTHSRRAQLGRAL